MKKRKILKLFGGFSSDDLRRIANGEVTHEKSSVIKNEVEDHDSNTKEISRVYIKPDFVELLNILLDLDEETTKDLKTLDEKSFEAFYGDNENYEQLLLVFKSLRTK